jgi:uncharacterized coiled-coil protein SlyX
MNPGGMASDEEALEVLAERLISLEGRNAELSKDVTGLKRAFDGHQGSVDRFEALFANDLARFERLETHQQNHSRSMAELVEVVEQQRRMIDLLAGRLDGKNIIQGEQYEKVVSQVHRIAESLQGGEGQLSYPQVRNSIQDTQFLGKVIKGVITIFGLGVFGTLGSIVFGVDKVDPALTALGEKIQVVEKNVDRLDAAVNADIQRQLDSIAR